MSRSKQERVLAVAAKTGRIACVLLRGGKLNDWNISRVGAKSPKQAGVVFKRWLEQFQPDTIISEDPKAAKRKSELQRDILRTFSKLAKKSPASNILVTRKKTHKNIYKQARALAKLHPAIAHKVPKQPPIWMPEPRDTAYFEALAMAEQVLSKN